MVRRKHFVEPNDIRVFRKIQERLPDHLKMRVLLCKVDDNLCAGVICSAMGDTGVYLHGATSNAGLKNRGSYLLHWKTIEWLKSRGITTYDLHGINPITNPGTYRFKADLCGSNGQDLHFLGQFESHTSPLSHMCVALAERLRRLLRHMVRRGEAQPPIGRDEPIATAPKGA
jgi:lipid II:glycine glycyltransferase (peptidoglycan interpeptide bridge formation enzyme)